MHVHVFCFLFPFLFYNKIYFVFLKWEFYQSNSLTCWLLFKVTCPLQQKFYLCEINDTDFQKSIQFQVETQPNERKTKGLNPFAT